MRNWNMLWVLCILLVGCKSMQKGGNNASEDSAVKDTASTTNQPPVESSEPKVATAEVSVEDGVYWQPYDVNNLPDLAPAIQPTQFDLWFCMIEPLREQLSGDEAEVLLPFEGQLMLFQLTNSGTMSPALAEKFPMIKSYKGTSHDGSISARVDSNEKGLFVSFKKGGEEWLLAPYLDGSDRYYAFYHRSDLPNDGRSDQFENEKR